MKKTLYLFAIILLFSLIIVSAQEASITPIETSVYYFYRPGCSHCQNVDDSGVLTQISSIQGVKLYQMNVLEQDARDKFDFFANGFDISDKVGTPFMVIEKNNQYYYLLGDSPIIEKSKDSILNFHSMPFNTSPQKNALTIGTIIIAALIDSINPCAFGVLLLLMATLLSLGSSKRALKAGLLYSLVIFLSYLAAGIGILRIINYNQSILYYITVIAGALIFIGGLIELKDFIWYGKGFSLRIPDKAKPLLERTMHKGTIPAILILGILVTLVELPCTGGIYLGILSLMSVNQIHGLGYLVLYNLIFILPLVVITFLIYKGEKIEGIKAWVENNKRWMRLFAGLIMIFLALYLLKVF